MTKTLTQYVTRIRRDDDWTKTVMENNRKVPYHPGYDAFETTTNENSRYVPGSFKKVPKKDKTNERQQSLTSMVISPESELESVTKPKLLDNSKDDLLKVDKIRYVLYFSWKYGAERVEFDYEQDAKNYPLQLANTYPWAVFYNFKLVKEYVCTININHA